jgi:hypothetical protein
MRVSFFISVFSILLSAACIDRLTYDIGTEVNFGISINGFISDQPGPYEIRINSIFDIESIESRKMPVSVRNLIISDNNGGTETLREVDQGIYQTDPSGIRGEQGAVYKISVELFDGRIYESLPDTILSARGSLDSLHIVYNEAYNVLGEKQYFFDLLFDASYDEKVNNHLLWKFMGTFQSETHPELHPLPPSPQAECFWLAEAGGCNYLPPCSGYRNTGSNLLAVFVKKYDCICCTCWYNLFNPSPILSDELTSGKVTGAKAATIPLNQWTLEHKIRLELNQMSLTRNTFRFWKAIRDQKAATGNLFQPISGKIPRNFVQISGNPIAIDGIFFAAAVNSQVKYLDRFQLPPNLVYAVSLDEPIYRDDCRKLFPNSTTHKPAFWKD